jgi:hypothetical protein
MILRALLSGNIVLFEEAMAELSDMPIDRVASYIHDRNISGFRALYHKAGLPAGAYAAFREAITAMREGLLNGEQGGAARLKRRMVEFVLERCAQGGGAAALLTVLRRFAVEAAREEARMFCDDLVANNDTAPVPRYAEFSASAPVLTEAVCSAPVLPELESLEPKLLQPDSSESEAEQVPAAPELLEEESSTSEHEPSASAPSEPESSGPELVEPQSSDQVIPESASSNPDLSEPVPPEIDETRLVA